MQYFPYREKVEEFINRIKALFLSEPYKSALPYTTLTAGRLKKLRELVFQLDKENIIGDVVECGVYNGGSSAILAEASSKSLLGRTLFLFDSFSGLPKPEKVDGKKALKYVGNYKGTKEKVFKLLKKVAKTNQNIQLIEGDFEKTIPRFATSENKISLLHIDADWYSSVKICLDNLYDKVEKGGFIVIDDYGYWEGCKKAVHDFEFEKKIKLDLKKIDSTAVYFQK